MKYLSSLKNKDLSKEICLLRVDFNITNEELAGLTQKQHPRILNILPTIKFLVKKKTRVVILSHRGRPAPLKQGISKSEFLISKHFSLEPFVKILSFLIRKPVGFVDLKEFGLIHKTKQKIQNSAKGSVFLMENLRFYPGEEKNDKKFAKQLASLATIYVNDAFSVSHRKNASIVAITKFLPSYAGMLLEKEIKNLSQIMKKPKRPLIIILGGAKISDKIGVIKNFLKKADWFLTGGGVANTFFAAQKLPVGKSLYEKEMIPAAKQLLKSQKIILPADSIIKDEKILDIGPKTIKEYSQIIKRAKTIIWNGPMGYIEDPKFAKGSRMIIRAILKSRAFAIVGGGETTAIFQIATQNHTNNYLKLRRRKFCLGPRSVRKNSRLFLSTGGGAMLDYLAGKKLPGIEALK